MISTMNEKWKVCRICLHQPIGEMKAIFSKEADSDISDLTTRIMNCGGIPINKLDGFPGKICDQCFTMLDVAYKFRTMCQNSHELLISFRFTKEDQDQKNLQLPSTISNNDDLVKIEEEFLRQHDVCEPEFFEHDNVEFVSTNSTEDDNIDEKELQRIYCKEPEEGEEEEEEEEYIKGEGEHIKEEELKSATKIVTKSKNKTSLKNKENSKKNSQVKSKIINSESEPIKVDFNVVSKFSDRLNKRSKCSEKIEDTYMCDLCGNKYNTKYKLNAHLKQHNKVKTYECEICHKMFSTSPQLSRHMNSHTGNRPFKCKMCPASFSDPSTCIKHQRIHTNERPFKCEECGKSFTYSNVLKVHLMIHSGEKPFSCEVCGKKFSQRHHKKAHLRTHSNSKHKKRELE